MQKGLKKYIKDSFSESSEMPRKKVYAVAVGHQTGIFDSWPSCQKATKGYKGAKFKSFDTRKQATSWLKENLESENLSAELSKEENGADKKQVKHCHTRCKFKGEDEKHGEMIECCLCRTWYHLVCLEKKSLRGNEKKTKDQQNEDDGQSASNVQEDSVEVFVKETQEDKYGEESEHESGDDDNDESESEEDINDGSGIWFCQDCENLPKTLREIKKSFNTVRKEFKSLKTRFEDIKVQSSSNDSEAVTPTFAENKAVDNTSEIEEKRKLVEQNIESGIEGSSEYNGKTIESSPARPRR